MTDERALYRLMTWLTPSFPVGAFSYSHGLEWVIEQGTVRDAESLRNWIADLLRLGSGRNDAILCAEAWRRADAADWQGLAELAELGLALAPSAERHLETRMQGKAFAGAIAASWPCTATSRLIDATGGEIAYPVAVGAAAAGHGLALSETVGAYLHAFVSTLISVGVRLIPLGQTDGQRLLAALEARVAEIAAQAVSGSIEDLGGATYLADIASMNHETQYTRLFRS
ncbi:MAG TPA: urease accessory protein UreF [Devosia sp.]|nr:urease accessory protein UreF [Devosia sp.]